MKKKIDLKAVAEGFEQLKVSLNGIDVATLPAEVASVITKIRQDADGAIAGIASFTEKVEVATEANNAISNVEYYLERIAELVGTVRGLATSFNTLAVSTNSRIEETVQKRIKDGDLIAKQSHETAVAAAREAAHAEGVATGRKAILSLNARKEKLTAAGLPIPSDDVLALPDEKFDPLLAAATQRKEKVTGAKLSLNGVFGGVMFASETEFNLAFSAATESRAAATPNPNPAGIDVNRAGEGPGSKTVKPIL